VPFRAGEPWNLDETPEQSDWIKRGTRDIPASNVGELRVYLQAGGWKVEQFKALLDYRAHLADRPWLRDL
jgi:hypothetical protein